MAKRIPLKTGDEYDALTGWKRYKGWRPGVRKGIKRGYNRRARRMAKMEIGLYG